MIRFLTVTGAVASMFYLIWSLIIIVTVKVGDLPAVRFLYWVSVLLAFLAPAVANAFVFRGGGKSRNLAILFGFLVSPVIVYFGIILMLELKVALGGHK